MKKKLFRNILLLFLFSFSIALAQEEPAFIDNTKIAVDFGFGFPLGWRVSEETKKSIKIEDNPVDFKISPNVNIGILASYAYSINQKITIGPELGIGYGFTRKFQITNLGISIEEKYIQVPIYLRVARTSTEQNSIGRSYVIGYDFNIILSSLYKQTGKHADITRTTFEGDKNLKEFLKDFPKLGGSVVVGGGLEFPKGIYFLAKLKLPIEFFKLIKGNDNSNLRKKELNNKFINATRTLSNNLVEFSIGVDIMKLIY